MRNSGGLPEQTSTAYMVCFPGQAPSYTGVGKKIAYLNKNWKKETPGGNPARYSLEC
jgi:hypothetical protein